MGQYSKSRGRTLIELMMAAGVSSVLMFLAVPVLSGMVISAQVQSSAQAMASSLTLARSEAVKRNERVVLCKSASDGLCRKEGGWEGGWIIFADSNNNGLRDPHEPLLHHEQTLAPSVQLLGNTPVSHYVSYTPFGRTKLTTGAFQAGTFTACVKVGKRTEARQVIINNAGRARMAKVNLAQCGAHDSVA